MCASRSTALESDVIAAFQTDESAKSCAARIGMSINTLRVIWKEAYGEEAFKARGKRLQATAASAFCKSTATTKVYKDVSVKCVKCQVDIPMKTSRSSKIDVTAFVCDQCRGDRDCPVCGLRVDGSQGLSMHFRHRGDAGDAQHIKYQQEQEEGYWQNRDHVTCLICSHRAETLALHLKAAHGITAKEYKLRYPGALIRSGTVTAKMAEAAKHRKGGSGKGGKKIVACPSCGVSQVRSKFLVPGTHDFRCFTCRQRDEETHWASLVEGEDYVQCLECKYKAENLTSHLQSNHPGYRIRHPDALVNSRNSAVRDKIAIRGISRPPEFGQKIREAKLLGFTMEDFKPFLEPDGTVDQRAMLKQVGCAYPTLKRYMDDFGLKPTFKYMTAAGVARRAILTVGQLKPFRLGNGKTSLAKASLGLGFCCTTIKKECRRLGLVWAHNNPTQHRCLKAVSEALGNMSYVEEWSPRRFTNPLSGHRFRFDGYFPDLGLVVEFQGCQHYMFPNAFMHDESYRPKWEAMLERDRIKREMINNAPNLIYLEILEDEPYADHAYLTSRLMQLGIL